MCSNCHGVKSHAPACALRRGCPACYVKHGDRCRDVNGKERAPHSIRKRVTLLTLVTC